MTYTLIPYLHKCMIRQNFSMPSPISIKQWTNMIFIERHCFSPVVINRLIMAGWHGHNCHYSLHITIDGSVITSLLLPSSGVVCDWDGDWSHTALAPAPGPAMHWLPPVTDNASIFVTFVTWALLSPCPSLISGAGEHHSICLCLTDSVSVNPSLFLSHINHPTSCICSSQSKLYFSFFLNTTKMWLKMKSFYIKWTL